MITVQEALDLILEQALPPQTTSIPLALSVGRVLQEALHADRDFPPFDRVTMDGIAIDFSHFDQGASSFPVEGICAAGSPQGQLQDPKNCLEVMTGCPRPKGTDTIIRYEDVKIENGIASLTVDKIRQGQNVHKQGNDRQSGSLIVPAGKTITAAEIGVAATVGKAYLEVSSLPKTVVISTGDELVAVSEKPEAHQIRRSNVHSIQAILQENGLPSDNCHLPDEKESIKKEVADLLGKYHLLLLSGGVSKGKYDYLPEVFEELGIKQYFHRVKQRPGKPFWFGKAPNGTLVFAFPGNPVSTFICTKRYFLPWLRKSIGLAAPRASYATLTEQYIFKPDLTLFLAVHLFHDETGQQWAKPIRGGGSGDLASLVDSNGILVLPMGKVVFERGEVLEVLV